MNKTAFDFCYVIPDLLSTTPRAYREIKTLNEAGYTVCLVCNQKIPYAVPYHKELIRTLNHQNFREISIKWNNRNLRTIFFKILHKLSWFLFKQGFYNRLIILLASNYTYAWQIYKSRHIRAKIYAGHRPASIPVINFLAKKFKGKTWFDIEDEHFVESKAPVVNSLMSLLIKDYTIDYFTDASRLIADSFFKNYNRHRHSTEILNAPVTPVSLHNKKHFSNNDGRLRFVWFSQTVKLVRGLGLFLDALEEAELPASLDIIGKYDEEILNYLAEKNLSHVGYQLHGFIAEDKIIRLCFDADIGLALDSPYEDRSRNLAITNKILTYAACENFIIATRTLGHEDFMRRFEVKGKLINFDKYELTNVLSEKGFRDKVLADKNKNNDERVKWTYQQQQLMEFINDITFH